MDQFRKFGELGRRIVKENCIIIIIVKAGTTALPFATLYQQNKCAPQNCTNQ